MWVRPLMVLVLLAVVGWWLRMKVEASLHANLKSVLQTTLKAEKAAVQNWVRMQQNIAKSANDNEQISATIRSLLAQVKPEATTSGLLNLPQAAELRRVLAPQLEAHKYNGFVILEKSGRIAASNHERLVGVVLTDSEMEFIREKVMVANPMMLPPIKSKAPLPDRDGNEKIGVPVMYASAPIRNESGEIIALLGFRIRPEEEFTRILKIARIGGSGETFAFNREGKMLSNSRFDPQLRFIRLLKDDEDSTLNISLRDPGVDMTAGLQPKLPQADQPLMQMAVDAKEGRSGMNTEGHRDYRGVPVVAAWEWLDEEGFGIATKVDVREANQTLDIISRVFWCFYALLAVSSLAMLVSMVRASRLAVQAQRDAIEIKRLGQYTLEEKLGEGGMGVVYRAKHAMLSRPTAVKFLDSSKANEKSIARFEREVQLTSQLNHPNTIAIYDYGRTPEGVFYYAMEYLDGLDLQTLVGRHGPQPEGRVIHILKQVCGSLAEAHSIGLIHRDVKPANILLNARGGMFDVVKLLDFGLVKLIDHSQEAQVTKAGGAVGTPMYMSPEAYQSSETVDGRTDLYAVGAVGYFLLTGDPPFIGETMLDVIKQQIQTIPEAPSQRLGQPISPELENLLLRCLAKSPTERPATANEIIAELNRIPTANSWTEEHARYWWRRYIPNLTATTPPDSSMTGQSSSTIVLERAGESEWPGASR
jgi:serine/threonine protein kinase